MYSLIVKPCARCSSAVSHHPGDGRAVKHNCPHGARCGEVECDLCIPRGPALQLSPEGFATMRDLVAQLPTREELGQPLERRFWTYVDLKG
jgi:hypothetical protein